MNSSLPKAYSSRDILKSSKSSIPSLKFTLSKSNLTTASHSSENLNISPRVCEYCKNVKVNCSVNTVKIGDLQRIKFISCEDCANKTKI